MDAEAKERGYSALLQMIVEADKFNVSKTDMVQASYEKIDYTFMTKLAEELGSADGDRKAELEEVQGLVNDEMKTRMGRAAEALKQLLGAGPAGMFKMIPDYMQRGKLDEALLLLLEANIKQAEEAGAKPAAELMGRLLTSARNEIDKAVEPEVRLLRQLLRMDSSEARKELLKQKISASDAPAILIAGQRDAPQSTEPEVKIRKFAQALAKLKSQFGNVDDDLKAGFNDALDTIAKEAEAVAREFGAGSDMTPQELQDLMWEKGSVSVWDLEKAEEEAQSQGGQAPWEGDAEDRLKGLSQDDLLRP